MKKNLRCVDLLSLSFMTVNEGSYGFGQLVEAKEQY